MFGQIRYYDSSSFVIVAGGDDLNNLIPREGKARYVCGIASHKVSIKNSKYTFVGNYEQVVLFSFKF